MSLPGSAYRGANTGAVSFTCSVASISPQRKIPFQQSEAIMREWVIETALHIYTFLLPFSSIAFAISLVLLGPLAIWRKTRGVAGAGLYVVSYLFGATTWFLGAAVTFGSFGWIGLIIGFFIFGIGVVPLGIFGAFFKLGINELGISLCVMLVITLAARFAGVACVAAGD